MMMRSTRISLCFPILTLLLAGAVARAASFTGTVTNKTSSKPSAGDSVALVDVQAGMSDAASRRSITACPTSSVASIHRNARRCSLDLPANNPRNWYIRSCVLA